MLIMCTILEDFMDKRLIPSFFPSRYLIMSNFEVIVTDKYFWVMSLLMSACKWTSDCSLMWAIFHLYHGDTIISTFEL
jgi:hypothetical protein